MTELGINAIFQDLKLRVGSDSQPSGHYAVFGIKRKGSSGRRRMVQAPDKNLRSRLRLLNRFFQKMYAEKKPAEVHGFIPVSGEQDISIRSNAEVHVGKAHILNIDLNNFFQSISKEMVEDVLINEFSLNTDLAQWFATFRTYKDRLPVGSPTSPVLSNMVCLPLDRLLSEYCQHTGLSYTRYADDMTFSANKPISKDEFERINALIRSFGFSLNKNKIRFNSWLSQQTVTGIVVNKKLNVRRSYIRLVRAQLYHLKVSPFENGTNKDECGSPEYLLKQLQQISGKLAYIKFIKGETDAVYQNLYKRYKELSAL